MVAPEGEVPGLEGIVPSGLRLRAPALPSTAVVLEAKKVPEEARRPYPIPRHEGMVGPAVATTRPAAVAGPDVEVVGAGKEDSLSVFRSSFEGFPLKVLRIEGVTSATTTMAAMAAKAAAATAKATPVVVARTKGPALGEEAVVPVVPTAAAHGLGQEVLATIATVPSLPLAGVREPAPLPALVGSDPALDRAAVATRPVVEALAAGLATNVDATNVAVGGRRVGPGLEGGD